MLLHCHWPALSCVLRESCPYSRQTKPHRLMKRLGSNHTLPLLGGNFPPYHFADFPKENHTWSPGQHRLVCYKQGWYRKLRPANIMKPHSSHRNCCQQLTLNPPPTSPRTFSMGTLVFSKWTSQAETHKIKDFRWKLLCTCSQAWNSSIHSFYLYWQDRTERPVSVHVQLIL